MTHPDALQAMIDRESIRELAQLYCRGVDRQDADLLRDLYTDDAIDTHGDDYDGPAGGFVDFLEQVFPGIRYSGHHVCNHLVSVDGDTGEGEVYAIAYNLRQEAGGGWVEDFLCLRYLDHYRRCEDGRWRFAKRLVSYDLQNQRPANLPAGDEGLRVREPGYNFFNASLFARGARAGS